MVEIEERMRSSLRFQMLSAIQDYLVTKRTDWMQAWPGMIVLNGSQVHWTREIEEAMASGIVRCRSGGPGDASAAFKTRG